MLPVNVGDVIVSFGCAAISSNVKRSLSRSLARCSRFLRPVFSLRLLKALTATLPFVVVERPMTASTAWRAS